MYVSVCSIKGGESSNSSWYGKMVCLSTLEREFSPFYITFKAIMK